MSKTIVFGSGIPTAPDVKKLRDAFGEPDVDAVVTYNEIEKVLREERHSNRFKGVVDAWRKQMFRELNIVFDAVPNIGYKRLGNSDRVHYSGRKYKLGLGRIRFAGDVATSTAEDGLEPDERKARVHLSATAALLRLTAATEARKIKYPDLEKPKK